MSAKKYSKGRANLKYRGDEELASTLSVLGVKKVTLHEVKLRKSNKSKENRLSIYTRRFNNWWQKLAKRHEYPELIKSNYALIIIVILVSATGFYYVSNKEKSPSISEVLSSQDQSDVGATELSAENDNSISSDSRYDSGRGVYQYKDQIEGVEIIVTQQSLPDDIRQTPSKIKNLALSTPNTTKTVQLVTNKGVVYLSKTDSGEQVVILIHNDLLIFINSNLSLPDKTWLNYINGIS